MKKFPEIFELNEEDIKNAINYWLNGNNNYDDLYDVDLIVKDKYAEGVCVDHFCIATAVKKISK
jgi:hypothetical protein